MIIKKILKRIFILTVCMVVLFLSAGRDLFAAENKDALLAAVYPTIKSIDFSSDFRDARVELDKIISENMTLEAEIYRDGVLRKTRSTGLINDTVLHISGFRSDFDFEGGEGEFTLRFAVCNSLPSSSGGIKKDTCGHIYKKTINYKKNNEPFSIYVSKTGEDYAVISTGRILSAGEYYQASCSPYSGVEDSSIEHNNHLTVGNLKPDTEYTCRLYIFSSLTGGQVQKKSQEVTFKTLPLTPLNPGIDIQVVEPDEPVVVIPKAGFEDEVRNIIENPFTDNNIETLEGKSAAELYKIGIIGGYPDGTFKGYRMVNRAEAAKFLLLALYGEVDEYMNNGKFADALEGEWYVKFIIRAHNLGIIQGYPNGLYRPEKSVNTAEFLKMITLTFGLEENLPYNYHDVPGNDWYAKYAGVAQKYDLFPQRLEELMPQKELTRNEVAVAIYQYLKNK